jgi:hypothetical protein
MQVKLPVFNPSNYPRKGHITVPWKRIRGADKLKRDELRVMSLSGRPLSFQVDRIIPQDSGSDEISFTLDSDLAPGSEHYSSPSDHVLLDDAGPALGPAKNPPGQPSSGFHLQNERLNIWFNLTPELGPSENACYSGCATSVQLDNREILDNYDNPGLHDSEKRALQIDQIVLSRPAWEAENNQYVSLFSQNYELLQESRGPVRQVWTVASHPFSYEFLDPLTRKGQKLSCILYRVLSLYAGADYVVEEVFVKSTPDSTADSALDLCFTARYFSYMRMGAIDISQFKTIPDWFVVLAHTRPFNAYGFATDVHATSIAKPHPEFPSWEREENSFSWHLYPCKQAKCVHLFMRENPPSGLPLHEAEKAARCMAQVCVENRIGHAWYELVYKPLVAGSIG